MRPSIGFSTLLLSPLGLVALAMPLDATADEAHSWCIPGAAKDRSGSSSPEVNQIVGYVCDQTGFGACCDRQNGKWSVACIQKASNYAFHTLNKDICGHYAWQQGPVAGTQQYYPRDFNVFAAGGSLTGPSDVQGPVASKGTATFRSFSLNFGQKEGLALAAQGGVSFDNGTVNGNVIYAGSYTARNVTYVNAYPPSTPSGTNPFPIDFGIAKTKLQDMSAALRLYPNTPGASASRVYGSTLLFTGTDPDLNVFSIGANLLAGIYNYKFAVPAGSAIIVNVAATSASIMNAGFTDADGRTLTASNMLWNFPTATDLTIQSVTFPGSVLAPQAAATIKWGAVNGTIAVWSGNISSEIHSNPFHFPSCGGCLCLNSSWSCSNDTLLNDDGAPAALGPEAGFLHIEGGDYTAENQPREAPDHRIWYSFRPADVMPKTKPLAVFFNGGPGAATSAMLFSFNTGPVKQVDPTGNATSLTLVSNAKSWTQFANLLYIDAPATGFSYPLPHTGNAVNDVGTDIDDDAGIFLRIIVQFLLQHPALLGNHIILVGESYGGTRASLMLRYLYEYASLTNGAYRNDRLYSALLQYFSAAYNTQTPSRLQIKSTFGHLALIDPVVVGELQLRNNGNYMPAAGTCLPSADIPDDNRPAECWIGWTTTGGQHVDPTCDPFNCNKPVVDGIDWGWQMSNLAGANLLQVSSLNQILGVNATTIEWMKASARAQAFGRDHAYVQTPIPSPPQEWLNAFGNLSSTSDRYYIVENDRVNDSYGCMRDFGTGLCTGTSSRSWYASGVDVGGAFVLDAYRLHRTLITVTKYDVYVPTQAVADGLNSGLIVPVLPCPQPPGVNCGAWYNPTYPAGACSLPGVMGIAYQPIEGHNNVVVNVHMPTAYSAGHSVTMQDGDRFASDIQGWYSGTPF